VQPNLGSYFLRRRRSTEILLVAGYCDDQACTIRIREPEGVGKRCDGVRIRPFAAALLQRFDGRHADAGPFGQGFLTDERADAKPSQKVSQPDEFVILVARRAGHVHSAAV
jgi:hypothetical protein